MLASFLKAGAVHSSACTEAFTKGCQMNPLTLAELEVEVMNICERWMKRCMSAPGSAEASTGLSKFPWAIGSAHLWHFPRLMDHLWKHIKTWYCWHTSNTNCFSGAYKSDSILDLWHTLLDEGFWASQHRSLHATHTSPAGMHPLLCSSLGEMTTVLVGSQTKWSHRLSLSQNPGNSVSSTQSE